MKRIIFFVLIIGTVAAGLTIISKNVMAANDNKLTDINSVVLSQETNQAVVQSLNQLFKEEFGENGYEFNEATAEYGAITKEFRYPNKGILANKKIDQKIESLIKNQKNDVTDEFHKESKSGVVDVTVCGRFYDWYFWTGPSITFCGNMGSYLQTNMGWFNNRANSFYEFYTSWGSNAYDGYYGQGYLMNVDVDYWSLGSANNKISSLQIWF